ncbi:MAG: YbaN family protein [Christensenellales bacterium]|jgi:uncharacterized membrane protein YbaN (DUF454 family)
MTHKGKLLAACGFVLLSIGALGIILPVLPTTPFVLAAAACFSRSGSTRLTKWLNKSKIFNDYITNYKQRKGLSKRSVIITLGFLWAMLAISVGWIQALWASVLMPCVGIAVTIHILYMARPRVRSVRYRSIQNR